MASRHLGRALVLQTLFESDLTSSLGRDETQNILKRNAREVSLGASDFSFAEGLLDGVLQKRDEIDDVIRRAAPQWPLDKVAPIDRNVLRIGLYELLFGDRQSVPPKVALNEAIEIAKSFGGDQSGKFVNGVLGSVYRDIGEPMKAAEGTAGMSLPLAGAVVVTEEDPKKVALVLDAFHQWTLPKARLAEGELTEAAALRAVREELGLSATVVRPLGEHRYIAHDPEQGTGERTVSFFLMHAPEAPLAAPQKDGILDAKWVSIAELDHVQVYEDLRAIIEAALA